MENRILKSLTEKPKYIVELTKEFGMKTDKMSRWIQYLEVQAKIEISEDGIISLLSEVEKFNPRINYDPKNTNVGYVKVLTKEN